MNNKKIKIFLLIFILFVLNLPIYTNAETANIEYIDINKTSTLTIENLYFDPIFFRNFSHSTEIFGLAGVVENTGDSPQNFVAVAKFYDESYNLVSELETNQYVPAHEKNSYSNMENISKINIGYTADDIKYYSLFVEIKNVENSSLTTSIKDDDYYSSYTSNNDSYISYSSNSNNYDYTIEKYHIDMIVNENNTFDITETIATNFNVGKHGIFRKIPLKNNITRLDGTQSKNRAQISKIDVSENYTTYTENGYKVIKIGEASKTFSGKHGYTIKYTYNIGKDPLKESDELYFNLIGDEWDTIINNVSFKITMPKEFDKSLLGFSSGEYGSTNNSNIKYNVKENIITGVVSNTLNPREALTIRLTLPEGYFTNAVLEVDKFSIFVIFVSVSFVVIATGLWFKYGKDETVIETVEFYPPEGYNSAEIGFIYDGYASNESIISLLIYLANKGYLKIEETEEEVLFSKSKSFKIIKLKEYDGNNECEKMFFEGLFKGSVAGSVNMEKARKIMQEAKMHGETISFAKALELSMESGSTKQVVTASELKNRFYLTLNTIKTKLQSKENKNKILESAASGKGIWLILMIITIFFIITIRPIAENSQEGIAILPFALLFPGIGFTILFSMLLNKKNSIPIKIFALFWGSMFGGMPWVMIVLPCLLPNTLYLVTYLIGIVCIAIIILFINIMPKRTPFGNEMLGKLRGFKRFLETAEKPQLESLVMNNPEYFYNILPYTYALGVSDVWINQFETIAIKPPNWYDSNSNFSIYGFRTFMDSTMTSAATAMTSSPSSSRGGSSSGGGSSGGGSGGGGGGSW